jgi:hypothetical protein
MRLSTSSRNNSSGIKQTDKCAEATREEITKVEEGIEVEEAVDEEGTEEEDVDEAHDGTIECHCYCSLTQKKLHLAMLRYPGLAAGAWLDHSDTQGCNNHDGLQG